MPSPPSHVRVGVEDTPGGYAGSTSSILIRLLMRPFDS
jgi:hypothetical protein